MDRHITAADHDLSRALVALADAAPDATPVETAYLRGWLAAVCIRYGLDGLDLTGDLADVLRLVESRIAPPAPTLTERILGDFAPGRRPGVRVERERKG